MKPQSAKAKGRNLQKWTRDKILDRNPTLHPDDVKSTSMGAQGEDVQLSPYARTMFPFNIECKSRAAMAVFKDYEQAKTHGTSEPLVIIKQNNSKPLAVVDAEYFINLVAEKEELTKQVGALLLVKGRK